LNIKTNLKIKIKTFDPYVKKIDLWSYWAYARTVPWSWGLGRCRAIPPYLVVKAWSHHLAYASTVPWPQQAIPMAKTWAQSTVDCDLAAGGQHCGQAVGTPTAWPQGWPPVASSQSNNKILAVGGQPCGQAVGNLNDFMYLIRIK
jgi:hypothetical protein